MVTVVIPARYSSTRLPAKILADIHGKPMIQWVYEQAKKATSAHRVIVATDDDRIVQVVQHFGGEALMTDPALASGTDRVAAVADQVAGDIFVNLQGDEPLIDPRAIDAAVTLVSSSRFRMSTVMTPIREMTELTDPSVVKVIADQTGRAIYFSRHPIPYSRGEKPIDPLELICRRHVGLYVFDRETLIRFRDLPPSALEKAEVLEQLRALSDGIAIGISEVDFVSIGVDTADDLERVRKFLASKKP
jgi:3-deoxy-manno-octulosonate cytidylyltransferase (CMP-KDO synthetase)